MANSTEQRNEITKNIMNKLIDVLTPVFEGEVFLTADNFTTITFPVGEVDGGEVYGSVKFTLHKANYDLDAEIEKYELFREERELKALAKEQAKLDKEKKLADQKAKAEARDNRKNKEVEKTRASIQELKSKIQED
jgi:Skp family chaperone for outer membrane proteins